QGYATNVADWRALAVSAAGGVSVSASDASLIDANSKVSSTSITTNDGGADFADDLTGFLYEVEFVSDGDAVTTDPLSLDPTTSVDAVPNPSAVSLVFGDRVRLTDDFPGGGAGTGIGGSVYEYLGVDATLDLANQDYTNLDIWKEIQATQLVPTGNNLSESSSIAIGGMAVLNDVRGDVEAWVNSAAISVVDGDIVVTAIDDGQLKATADNTAESSGGSAYGTGTSLAVNGTIATNVLQGSATAWVVDSSLATVDSGSIRITADNSADLAAVTRAFTQTGDTAVSFLLAFNSIGWESQNLLYNAIDALIGTDIGDQSVSAATAYIQDSNVVAAGDIGVDAASTSTVNSEVS